MNTKYTVLFLALISCSSSAGLFMSDELRGLIEMDRLSAPGSPIENRAPILKGFYFKKGDQASSSLWVDGVVNAPMKINRKNKTVLINNESLKPGEEIKVIDLPNKIR